MQCYNATVQRCNSGQLRVLHLGVIFWNRRLVPSVIDVKTWSQSIVSKFPALCIILFGRWVFLSPEFAEDEAAVKLLPFCLTVFFFVFRKFKILGSVPDEVRWIVFWRMAAEKSSRLQVTKIISIHSFIYSFISAFIDKLHTSAQSHMLHDYL